MAENSETLSLKASVVTPPQNDVVERKNRTLVEMVQTMLDEHRTPRRFWAETVNIACYIANRIFLRAFLGKTSYEVRFGNDEEGTPIFEDEEGVDNVGDVGATSSAAASAPSATRSDDEGGPLPTASSSLPRQQAQVEAGPAEDAGEVTSEIVPSRQVQRDHPPHRIIGDLHQRVTRYSVNSLAFSSHSAFVASFEPWDVSHALSDPNWVNAMHEELENFERNHVWDLVESPPNCRPIGTKWVFKNKQGENGMVVRNKVRLVARKEGIDYEETFSPVARLEANRILLDFAASKGFKLQQMNVKSAFLNGYIEEEVYVRQSSGFESAKFPDQSWRDTLIVQIYVDDIIFGGSFHTFLSSFAKQMSREFEMSLMGKLQFFLGLQIKQGPEGTFVHQAKYTKDILKKFDMGDSKPMTTPMSTNTALDADEDGEAVDQKEFRGMIGSLLFLMATKPDIQFAVCLCARYQASPRTSHRQAVKRIFRYLKFTPELDLWYSSGSSLSLRGFSDACLIMVGGVDNALIKGEMSDCQWYKPSDGMEAVRWTGGR
ncbi:hypothetical protein U9M48_008477 [Paspalum notatum var. saurae]|uniref:Reverse transcriptase Ty1/copia-type domain-containing protein n=1 Tax=Paspalum notatum var. saurae TaxID=547442 RepID=A0AAQ3WDB0_PASNO